MGLATIDPHSHKVQTKFYKIPKFGLNRLSSKIQPFEYVNLTKKCMAIRTLSELHSVRKAIHFFVNFDVFKEARKGF